MTEKKEGLIDGRYIDGLRASGTVGAVGVGYGVILEIPMNDIGSAKSIFNGMWK